MDEVLAHLERDGNTISIRGDSAFYNAEYLDYLDHNDIKYFIRAKNHNSIQNKILESLDEAGIDYLNYTHSEPYYGEIDYHLSKMNTSCRYIYKIFPSTDKQLSLFPVVYCVITNDTAKTCKEICDFYEERGNSENFTKELKDDFDGNNVGHYEFEKNYFQFMISSLCYNLYHIFRLTVLEGDDQLIRMNTFRYRYQKEFIKYYQKLQILALKLR